MPLDLAKSPPPRLARAIVQRTRGHSHGPITRLVSPSDLGEIIKPFVFLDYFDIDPKHMPAIGFHPHSGIATLTVVLEGRISYEETSGTKGVIEPTGVEWMRAAGGVWHTGGVPARVILGRHGAAISKVAAPTTMNYLDVTLKKGEKWRYEPPHDHTVAWVALHKGKLATPEIVGKGELAVFEESNAALEFEALEDTGFILGSAVKHPHDLVLGMYSVHTSQRALDRGEARIAEIGKRLRAEGRL